MKSLQSSLFRRRIVRARLAAPPASPRTSSLGTHASRRSTNGLAGKQCDTTAIERTAGEQTLVGRAVVDLVVGLRAAPNLRRRPRSPAGYAGAPRGNRDAPAPIRLPPRSRIRPDRAPGGRGHCRARTRLRRAHHPGAGTKQPLLNRGREPGPCATRVH